MVKTHLLVSREKVTGLLDAKTTRFLFISQAIMLLASILCAIVEAGQSWVYIITTAAFMLYVGYALRSGNQFFQNLLLMGLVAGFMELWADNYSVQTVGALLYPDGPLLVSSPLYMPLSWAVALTQLGYTSALLLKQFSLKKAAIGMAVLGALYIPMYEQLAKNAGWWFYHNCPMLWNAPYYIILCEALISLGLPLLVLYMAGLQRRKAIFGGLAMGLWIGLSAWGAYTLVALIAGNAAFFEAGAYAARLPALSKLVNLQEYAASDIAFILLGTIFWNIAYYIIIRDGFRNKFVEMPVPAAAANLAWEFVWGFMFVTDLGPLFVWGLRIWFFMDLLIFYCVLRYGAKQLSIPAIKKYFIPIELCSVVIWGAAFYFFIREGYDTGMGATSAYMITVIMASLYVIFYLGAGSNQRYYAKSVAWMRLTGNACMSLFVVMHYPEMDFLKLLCGVVLFMNALYVFQFSVKIQEIPVNWKD